nr:tripartite tricarboxylate transporter substrate binding protein [Comamonas jiangduensis]
MNITHRNPIQRRHLLLAGASLAAAGLPSLASAAKANAAASTWPSKPIRLIVPYPAGGINDVVARMLGDQMGQTLGQPFVVDNKPGAGATIGMAELAKADDQHTFAFGAISPLTLNPYLMKVAYDPMHDIIPVASVMYAPVYVLATTAFRGRSFADVLAQAQTRQGVSVATSGYGTLAHIMVEQLIRATGGKFVHVPYKGGSQLVTDAAGAQFDLLLANPFAPINALIEQGKLRVLATTGPQRAPSHPDIPTLAELGAPQANLTSLFGFMAPAGTPAKVVQRINTLVQELVQTDDIQAILKATDNIALHQDQATFEEVLRKESASNAAIIQKAGIRI